MLNINRRQTSAQAKEGDVSYYRRGYHYHDEGETAERKNAAEKYDE